jgi:ribosome-binding protein aMBF1 (putative translation factor)
MNNRTVVLDTAACVSARRRKGLSRERPAEQSRGGISVAALKRLERGDKVYLATAHRLAKLLEVSLSDQASGRSQPGAARPAEARRSGVLGWSDLSSSRRRVSKASRLSQASMPIVR